MVSNLVENSDLTVPFTLQTSDGETLWCDARYPANAERRLPVVVFVHGFKGFKDWGGFPYVCDVLARRGFYVVAFNFSHNGVQGHSQEFTRLDRFERNTFSREVRELREVIDAVAAGAVPAPERADGSRIAILGHSRGGGITILEASSDNRVKAVATWAAVASFNRYTERQKSEWRERGVLESKNMRTGQMMRLGLGLLDDLEQNSSELDIAAAAERFVRPLLIVHGEQDLSVRIEDGEELARRADPAFTDFMRVPHTNHTFGAVHPFEGTTPALEEVLRATAGFLERHLYQSSH